MCLQRHSGIIQAQVCSQSTRLCLRANTVTCLLDAATRESRGREWQAHAHHLPSLSATSSPLHQALSLSCPPGGASHREFSGDDPWKGGGGLRGVENKGIMRTPTADRKAARVRGKDRQDQAGAQGERQAGIKTGAQARCHTKAKQDTRIQKAAHSSGFFFPSIFAPDSLRRRHKRAADRQEKPVTDIPRSPMSALMHQGCELLSKLGPGESV